MVSFSTLMTAGSSSPQDGTDPKKTKPLDVVFVQDTTGSQGPYINSARRAIRGICDRIAASAELSQDQIRFGLIAFRDHPPQDTSYVTKEFGFTSDIEIMQKNLSSLIASGGGDGPEAQTAAIAAALNLEWAEDAIKMVILITDAPPHGLGEYGDGFDKSPDHNDPLEIARQMAERGMTLFVIGCEPALSMYKHAVDFYSALSQITSGRVFPLTMADKLGDYIVGTAIETIETEKLIGEFEKVIVDEVYNKDAPVENVVDNLQEFMKARGVKINSVNVDGGYAETETFKEKVNIWHNSKDIGAARAQVGALTPAAASEEGDDDEEDAAFSLVSDSDLCGMDRERDRETETMGRRTRARRTTGGKAPRAQRAAGPTGAPPGFAFGAPGWAAAPPPPPACAAPAFSMLQQDMNRAQTRRVVMQSMARNSKVTSEGMIDRATGKSVATSAYSPSPLDLAGSPLS